MTIFALKEYNEWVAVNLGAGLFYKLESHPDSKMEDFIQFIDSHMRNVNISLSLKKIYARFRKCSYYFLDYEMNSNNDSNENLFLLNLFMKCKNNIEKT